MFTHNGNSGIQEMMLYHADAHGQAALVLVESLLHGLMEESVLTLGKTVEIIETAIEVQADVAEAADGAGQTMWQSHSLLLSISASLKRDLDARDETMPTSQA